jgi:hypothetical protein
LARSLLHFALCQQGLWLNLCHATLLLIPRKKKGQNSVSEVCIGSKGKKARKDFCWIGPSSIKQNTSINSK